MLDISRMLQLAGVINESLQLDEAREDMIAQTKEQQITQAYQQDTGADKPELGSALDIVKFISTSVAVPPKPTSDYIVRVMEWYINGQFKLEDVATVQKDLATFTQVKPKLEHKDINQYKSLFDLRKALLPFEGQDIRSGKEKEKEAKAAGITSIINTPNMKVFIPLTQEAACTYGKGTKWCTAAETNNRFEQYNKNGKLYIIITKDNRKFQLHMEDNQFMNELDQEVTKQDIEYLSQFPEYKEFLNYLIKHYYS